MRTIDGQVVFSPSDLAGFLACGHLTELDRAAFAKLVARPHVVDQELDLLRRKATEHEFRYLERLRAEALQVPEIPRTRASSSGFSRPGTRSRGRSR